MTLEKWQEDLVAIHKEARKTLIDYFRLLISDSDDYVKSPACHYTVNDILLNGTSHFAVEMFRESAKSSLVLKAFPLYRLTYPKKSERYIVLLKQNQRLAEAKLTEISKEYQSNAVLNYNLIKVKKDSASAIEFVVMDIDGEEVTVRIEAYGKGSSIRGLTWGNLRPQVLIGDDLQDLEDSKSEVTLEKDWEWFLSDVKFLAKYGRIFLIGNNLGKKCIIERVIDGKESLDFESLRLAAIDDNGNPTWPERFSKEFLEREKQQFGALGKLEIWYRERMCLAIAPETQKFRREYFKFYREEELPEKFDIDITIDPAISKRKEACNTAIVAVAKNRNTPNWYVLDYKAEKYDPGQLIDATFKMFDELKALYPNAFIRVYVEGVAYQEALKYFFEEEMRRRKVFMFLDTFIDKTDKEQRILGLVPLFKVGVIYLRGRMTELMDEALLFPVGKTVDILDSLSFHQHVKINTTEEHKDTVTKTLGVDGNLAGLIKRLQQNDNSTHWEDTIV